MNRAVERESGLSKVENLTKKMWEQGVRVVRLRCDAAGRNVCGHLKEE